MTTKNNNKLQKNSINNKNIWVIITTTVKQLQRNGKYDNTKRCEKDRQDNIFSGIICSMQIATKTSAGGSSHWVSCTKKGKKITVITKIVEKIAKITENTKMLEYSTK